MMKRGLSSFVWARIFKKTSVKSRRSSFIFLFLILAHTHIIDDCCPQVTINDQGVCVRVRACVIIQYVCVVSALSN